MINISECHIIQCAGVKFLTLSMLVISVSAYTAWEAYLLLSILLLVAVVEGMARTLNLAMVLSRGGLPWVIPTCFCCCRGHDSYCMTRTVLPIRGFPWVIPMHSH